MNYVGYKQQAYLQGNSFKIYSQIQIYEVITPYHLPTTN